jgi:hypothetical protein
LEYDGGVLSGYGIELLELVATSLLGWGVASRDIVATFLDGVGVVSREVSATILLGVGGVELVAICFGNWALMKEIPTVDFEVCVHVVVSLGACKFESPATWRRVLESSEG